MSTSRRAVGWWKQAHGIRSRVTWRMVCVLAGLLLSPTLVGAANAQTAANGLVDQGRELFKSDCAACHGAAAHGDGPLVTALNRAPPNLTLLSRKNGGEFPTEVVYRKIDGRELPLAHGSSDMPVWGELYKRALPVYGERRVHDRLTALIAYLKSLQVE